MRTAGHLLAATRRILYEHWIIIPGRRRLGELAGEAATTVERHALEVIEREIPAATRAQWSAALSQSISDTHLTLLACLQEPTGKFLPSTIKKQFNKVVRLRDLGVSRHIVAAFKSAQQQAYALEMRRRRPSRSAQLREPRRTVELVSFLQHALFEHTDFLIRLVDRGVSQLWRRASEDLSKWP